MTPQDFTKDVVLIDSIDAFVTLLSSWHEAKVTMLKHMQNIPTGTTVSFNDGPMIKLKGNMLKGFSMGVAFSLVELGTLPFNTVEKEEEVQEAGPNAG